MDQFSSWLQSKGIDCQCMTAELLGALRIQYEREREASKPPESVIVLPETIDGRWATALRLPVEVGA